MKHFLEIATPTETLRPYARFNARLYRSSKRLAKKLSAVNIIHVNSTPAGGGVAELLKNQIPLEKGLGLAARWLVLKQPKRFFAITKKIHNLLQGGRRRLTAKEKEYYLNRLRLSQAEFKDFIKNLKGPRIVILHDPQVLPLINCLPTAIPVISRLHIDLSKPDRATLAFLKPYLKKTHGVVLSHHSFRPNWFDQSKTIISCPAINPFAPKNIPLKQEEIVRRFMNFGLDVRRPIITQISRFDLSKDPAGVITAYQLAKKSIPGLQLVLEGSLAAADDPEAEEIYRQLKSTHRHDKDLFLHGPDRNLKHYGSLWVNALQRGADIVIQKSLKEGFGLTVTEGLWKGKPVIGGHALGIKQQIRNGRNGFTVATNEECARRIVQLLRQPVLARRLGAAGRRTVRKNFLFNRLIHDFLKIYQATQNK